MSTISIMPISTKIRVSRRAQIPYSRKLSASANIEKASMLLGNELILDEGCIVRVDGFSARATEASYPEVKLSIFPEGGKMGSIYVDLNEMDGLTWEPVVEVKTSESKKDRGPVRRYDVVLNGRGVNADWVWHSAFNERYDVTKSELKLINPLALTPEERVNGFKTEDLTDIGEAMFSLDRSKTTYILRARTVHYFLTEVMADGLLGAKCISTEIFLEIGNKWEPRSFGTVCVLELNETDVVKATKDWLKERHKEN